ncbi:thioredoxin family protein [Mariniblastus fucicola]|uniref:Disulfide bond reductase DsbH n=1 Tax=Mariniblastus fucicola TaxID=980251 RepID=A0A5B9P3W7_9BACT|nr:thioredoxin family protein [Mariniblastus fucicola]QEG21297.1 Disulfide bond reductase DsbH precursor [Mariniblastus fucicola]
MASRPTFFAFLSIVVVLTCRCVHAEEGQWSDDPTSAIKTAAKDNKDLLLLYTGSDWCPPCKKLEQEVFSDEDFYAEAEGDFVFVKFDFLKNSPLRDEVKKKNEEWARKFGVDSFPTIVLVDPELKPYAFAGYEEGGTENFLGMLEESRQVRITRDEKMKAAAEATGDDRARLLDEALSGMPREISDVYYSDIIEEIVKLDEDDELGLRTKWNEAKDAELRKSILTDVMMVARLDSPKRAIAMIDEILGEVKFTTKQRLEIMQIKLNLVRKMGNPALVDDLLDEMIALEGLGESTVERLIVKKVYLMVGSKRRDKAMKYLEQSIKDSQAKGNSGVYLLACKGELLDSVQSFDEAVETFDLAIEAAKNTPDVLAEVVSGKADSLYAAGKEAKALQVLDTFADDIDVPADLRAEALLHKSMLMRESGKQRTARLVENRAIEIIESTKERTEIQSVVERLRKKYEK